MRRSTSLALGLFLACGGLVGALVSDVVPAGLERLCAQEIQKKQFVLSRPNDNLVEITEARWFFLPLLFGDFDLQMDIELGEGVELDMLLRQVEPRLLDDEILPFAGRFSVLRLSTNGDGLGWRTQEQALLDARGDGVSLAAGHQATVWVEARGRQLRANVAGKWQPWFEADDVYGMMTMVVRGGKAVVHRLEITPHPITNMWLWSSWVWVGFGVLGSAVVAVGSFLLSRQRHLLFRLMFGGILHVVFTWWIMQGVVMRQTDVDLAFPDPGSMLLMLCGFLALSLVFITHQVHRVALLLMAATGLGLLWMGTSSLQRDTWRIDKVFGPKAGAQISEAHGQRVRGPAGILDTDREGHCVFLLGGQLLYNKGQPSDHMSILLGQQLRGELRVPVDVPALPTVDGYSEQQWRMFDGFYQGFKPDVVVFGLGALEGVDDELTETPRSSAAGLAETLRSVQQNCAATGRGLVLFADGAVPRSFMLELRKLQTAGVPLVVAVDGEEQAGVAKKLAAACKPFLK